MSTATIVPLNETMSFDHVVQVHDDGKVTDAPSSVWAPSLYDDELDDARWTLMCGYSGQDSYSGPIMHDSEFIGGALEKDIKGTPGYYVALVNYSLEDDSIDGWAVAFRPV